jgi:hypothetical protein
MPEPYQAADGRWIIFDGTSKRYFSTESEAHMAARETAFVQAAKAANTAIWDGINALVALQREWVALDYGTTLDAAEGVNGAAVGAVVFDTANALVAVLNAGHATNMAKLL